MMNKLSSLSLLVALSTTLLAQDGELPSIKAFQVDGATKPLIDGSLSDVCWEQAEVTAGFWTADGSRQVERSARVQIAYDDEHVYIAMWCPLDDGDGNHLAQVVLDPMLEHQREFGLAEDFTKRFYTRRNPCLFRFAVDPDNRRKSDLVGAPWYRVPWRSATYRGNGYWTAELVIPVASLAYFEPIAPKDHPEIVWTDKWGVNFGYGETRWIANLNEKKQTIPLRKYNPLVNQAGYPLRYGLATGFAIDPTPHRWLYGLDSITEDQRIGSRVIGDVQVVLTVSNFTEKQRRILVRAEQVMGDGTTNGSPYTIAVEHEIGNQGENTGYGHYWRHSSLKLPVTTPGPHPTLISIIDADTGAVLSHRAILIDAVQVGYGLWDRSYYMQEPKAQLTLYTDAVVERGKTVQCDLRLRGDDEILHRVIGVWDNQNRARVWFDMESLPHGDYVVTATVKGQPFHPFHVPLRKVPPKPGAVQYTDRGVLLRDGKPFFPIGYYYVKNHLRSDPEFRTQYAEAGFTSYILEWMGPAGYVETSKTMSEHGLYPIISMQKFGYEVTQYDDRGEYSWDSLLHGRFPMVRRAVHMVTNMASEHILLWYSRDEPNENMYNMVKGYQKIVREIDPYHPIYVPLATPSLFPVYRDAIDIAGPYCYPNFPGGDVSIGGERVAKAKREMPGRPVMPVVQTFVPIDYSTGNPTAGMRQPNRAELRCMVFHSIVNGATGIIYFSYFHGGNQEEVYPETWANSVELAGHVRALAPVILSEPQTDFSIETDGREGIQARLFKHEDSLYIIAVNHEEPPQHGVTFTLRTVPDGMLQTQAAQVMFEERQAQVTEGSWSDDFETYAVHVYKLDVTTKKPH